MSEIAHRFDRQVRFASLGEAGQKRLQEARVLMVGCGALGGAVAQNLTRSGVGKLVLVDRDVVEETNLARQVLFEPQHAENSAPKAQAASETLARIGGPTQFEVHDAHLDASNIEDLAEDCDLVLDGTDNLSTRYLINDYCVESKTPWVYGGVVGSGGLCLAVIPGVGPCLRCLFPEPAPPGSLDTCDSAGVLMPAVSAVAALQAGAALRLLAKDKDTDWNPELIEVDVWEGSSRSIRVRRDDRCPACAKGEFPFLNERKERSPIVFCGRNAVQVLGSGQRPDLERLMSSLDGTARNMKRSGDMLRFEAEDLRVTVFPDGRALIEGTSEAGRARAAYDRLIGS